MTLTVGSLFAGIGGFDLGLERTGGFRTAWFCEKDRFCQRVLAKHWPGVPCYEDVCALTGASVSRVDVLCGGFPCQDISLAGKGAGIGGSRSGLWSEYARLIGEIEPRWVIVENVAALLGRGLSVVLADLSALGYDAEWDCIRAADFGAPHLRNRIWIVAYPHSDSNRRAGQSERNSKPKRSQILTPLGRDLERLRADLPYPQRVELREQPVCECGGEGSGVVGDDGAAKLVADPSGDGWRQGRPRRPVGDGPNRQGFETEELADTEDKRHERRGTTRHRRTRPPDSSPRGTSDWWATEPDVGRVANGVTARVDRLRSLGNALVPQIPEWIGYRILAYEAERGRT